MSNAIRRIDTVEDMAAGLNLRVIPNSLFIATLEALGTKPMSRRYAELYSAMENGAADTQETPIGLIYTSRFYEVQDHLALTGHVYTPLVLLASDRPFDSLFVEDKPLVLEAAAETEGFQRTLSRNDVGRLSGLLEQEGMEITRPTPEAIAVLRERVAPDVEQFSEAIGVNLVNKARSDMAAAAQ